MTRSFGLCIPARWLTLGISVAIVSALFCSCATRDTKDARHEVEPLYSAASPTFRQATGALLGSSFVPGNSIVTLVNGREIFPAMLSAIRSARRSIDFESYIYWDGEIGKMFADALTERARAGVKVNAILDAQGTRRMGGENQE